MMRRTVRRALFAALVVAAAGTTPAQAGVLDHIEVDRTGERPEIRIHFTQPMRYVANAPAEFGRFLQIQLRPIATPDPGSAQPTGRETLSWLPTADVPLRVVEYHAAIPDQPEVTLQFSTKVRFRVRAGTDFRSLVVSLLRPAASNSTKAKDGPSLPVAVVQNGQDTGKSASIMDAARTAMTAKEYRRAIQLYTKILNTPDDPNGREAQELLALARERNGQLAHAKAEYETYLRLYPKGEGADRVRQRLAGLLTAAAQPKSKLRKAKKSRQAAAWDTSYYGSVSQSYSRDQSFTDADENTVNQSAVFSDLDAAARARNARFDLRSQFIGGHVQDFRSGASASDSRVNALYVDAHDQVTELSGRLGRQSRSTGGVLGRFDGALLGYRALPWLSINGVAGFPVVSATSKNVDTDKRFVGLSLDLGTFAEHWDFNAFLIDQVVDDITDRRAVGGEARYFDLKRSFFGLVDYDVSYGALNTLLLVGTWTLPDHTTLNATLDYRKSPILTTSNALQGQSVGTINELVQTFEEDTLRDLAEDRTATSRSLTVGASRPITEKLQIGGEVTVTNLTGTEASGGVEANPATGNEFFYSAELLGSNLLTEGDIAIVGLRYSDTSSSDTVTFDLNTRYPVNREWRVNPRLRVTLRDNSSDGSEQITVRPSVRVDYRWTRRVRLNFEGGAEWSNLRLSDQTDETQSYFVTVGYRVDF